MNAKDFLFFEDNNMKNVSEYDKRQLMLMLECLCYFEGNGTDLSSVISSLEFLLNALDKVDEEWEGNFLKEMTMLETISALENIEESGEQNPKIPNCKKEQLIKKSIERLKVLINGELIA